MGTTNQAAILPASQPGAVIVVNAVGRADHLVSFTLSRFGCSPPGGGDTVWLSSAECTALAAAVTAAGAAA